MPEKISFLFGSGISLSAGMPDTKAITEKILSGEGIMRGTDARYNIGKGNNPMFDYRYIPEIMELLKIIYQEIRIYYYDFYPSQYKLVNYEDLYYTINEIEQDLAQEVENPGLRYFIDKISVAIKPKLLGNSYYDRDIQFHELVIEAKNYIRDIVKCLLQSSGKKVNYLNFIKDFVKNMDYCSIYLNTLNHDPLLEEFLEENKIKFIDGFNERDSNHIRYWNADLFEQNQAIKTKLNKLHGSTNLYRLRLEGGDWYDEKVGIISNRNPDRSKREGKGQFPPDNRPLMLIGSFNKVKEYTDGIFLYLFTRFYRTLSECDKLIISGYGFQDKGINSRITEWVYTNRNKRILIIDPHISELKEKSRGAISNKWVDWTKAGILKTINSHIEFIKYDEIMKNITA